MSDATGRASLLERIVLNTEQSQAVVYDDGPQLVFAGAGTGKTRVLTAKIAWLIEDRKIAPSALFAATFTNKAAREMKSRIENLTELSCQGLWIGTFHSLCARILRRDASAIGYSHSFSIYDQDDQSSIIRRLLKELGIEERAMTPSGARAMISHWKSSDVSPENATGDNPGYQQQQAARLYRSYQDALLKNQAMDFDDLLLNAVRLFREHPQVLARYRSMFKHVLVDEYQDTNKTQFQLVHLLASGHGKVFVVGDDDQSIYGWRGALVENILSFEKAFPGTRTFRLEQNYRSIPAVLQFANAAIEPNATRAPKKLWTTRRDTAEVILARFADDRREAESICRSIARLITGGNRPCDILILFRTNAQSRSFEEALRREKIAYTLVGGISFYQRREIKDCLAYLRLLVNRKDDVSFERIMNVPARGLGPKAREELGAAVRGSLLDTVLVTAQPDSAPVLRHKGITELRSVFSELLSQQSAGATPEELLRQVLELTGYLTMLEDEKSEEAESRVENINELLNALAIWSEEHADGTLEQFLEEVALISDLDMAADDSQRVSLMTLHSAKGLEAKHVFLSGVEDGLLPARQNMEDDAKIEEERRLFYVGITRAKDSLQCSYTDQRWRFGSIVPMRRSRFLDSIPTGLYRLAEEIPRYTAAPVQARTPRTVRPARSESYDDQTPAYESFSQVDAQLRMGQRVKHKLYGQGQVLNISGFNDDMRVTVLFNDGSRRRMLVRFAGLEPA